MEKYVCAMCGYVELKEDAPEKCPSCGAPRKQFKKDAGAIKQPEDLENKTDLEKKHIPLIKVNKSCSFVEGCTDLHVKMGEIIHPMEEKHYIMFIDFYLDEEFISRLKLTPRHMKPAGCLHLDASEGKLSVIEHCNLHGNWIAEEEL